MTSRIIGLFNSRVTNPRNAQLIFTTHDTNLLNAKPVPQGSDLVYTERFVWSLGTHSLAGIQGSQQHLSKRYLDGEIWRYPCHQQFERLFDLEEEELMAASDERVIHARHGHSGVSVCPGGQTILPDHLRGVNTEHGLFQCISPDLPPILKRWPGTQYGRSCPKGFTDEERRKGREYDQCWVLLTRMTFPISFNRAIGMAKPVA